MQLETNATVRSNTRKGPDLIFRLIDIFSVILWGFQILNIGLLYQAKPVDETFLDRLFNVKVRDYWDYQLLQLALILSLVQFVVSLISLYLNSKRLKRKNDRIRISIIISIFSSLALCFALSIFVFF